MTVTAAAAVAGLGEVEQVEAMAGCAKAIAARAAEIGRGKKARSPGEPDAGRAPATEPAGPPPEAAPTLPAGGAEGRPDPCEDQGEDAVTAETPEDLIDLLLAVWQKSWCIQWSEQTPTRKDQRRLPGFDQATYRRRSVVERCIGWLKDRRRLATRFEKLAENFLAMVKLAMLERLLKTLLLDTVQSVTSANSFKSDRFPVLSAVSSGSSSRRR